MKAPRHHPAGLSRLLTNDQELDLAGHYKAHIDSAVGAGSTGKLLLRTAGELLRPGQAREADCVRQAPVDHINGRGRGVRQHWSGDDRGNSSA